MKIYLTALALSIISVTATAALHPFYDSNSEYCGYKNESGKVVVPSNKYSICGNHHEGLAEVGAWRGETILVGYIDQAGKLVIPVKYPVEPSSEISEVKYFSNGLVPVYKPDPKDELGGLYGFMDKSQKLVIPYRYPIASSFSEGRAVVGQFDRSGNGNLYGAIDTKGQLMVPIKYSFISGYKDGFAVYGTNSNNPQYGFLDLAGKIKIPAKWSAANSFHEGLAAVYDTDKWGFINTRGNYVVTPKYSGVKDFSEGLAAVQVGGYDTGKWGFINKDGSTAIGLKFNDVESFVKGQAPVRSKVGSQLKWGSIDKKGNYMIAPQYDAAFILVETDEDFSDIDYGHHTNSNIHFYNYVNKKDIYSSPIIRYTFNENTGKLITSKQFKHWDAVIDDFRAK